MIDFITATIQNEEEEKENEEDVFTRGVKIYAFNNFT